MTKKKDSVIRKGNPFKPSDIEGMVLKGLTSTRSMHRDEMKFYVSDVTHCPRRAVKFLHTKRRGPIGPASATYMTIGIAIHEMVTDALFKAGRLIFKEFRLPKSEEPDIRGIVDAIFFGVDDKIEALEIKSCGNLPGRPRPEHEGQALLYDALTGLDMSLLYVSRKVAGWDQQLMLKSFDVESSDDLRHSVLSKVCLAYFAAVDDVLPPMPSGFKRDSDCRFCGFADECWDGEDEDLPEPTVKHLGKLYDWADTRAEELLEKREEQRNGIIKHMQMYGTPDVQRKLKDLDWS